MTSTYWVRYSDYELTEDESKTEWVRPKKDSVPMSYDVCANFGKNISDVIKIALNDKDETKRTMDFVKRFGLLGMALEEDYYMTLPEKKADMEQAVFSVCNRTDERYAGVFSPDYAEKSANISAWLDWMVTVFNRGLLKKSAASMKEPFSALTLSTILESGCRKMLADRTLKRCAACGVPFYDEDPEKETCEDKCAVLYDNMKNYQKLKKIHGIKPVAGG